MKNDLRHGLGACYRCALNNLQIIVSCNPIWPSLIHNGKNRSPVRLALKLLVRCFLSVTSCPLLLAATFRKYLVFVSFVIPALNEAESISELAKRIGEVCDENSISHEIIFVDDGSTDQTWQVIEELSESMESMDFICGIRLRRNFGKADALNVGIQNAKGDIIITMDADLQDDPAEIPKFLQTLDSGVDVVSGWKRIRHDPWSKRLPSLVFNFLVSRLTGVRLHDHNCGFKAYRRQVFDDINLYGERHRFVPVLASAQGWKIGEIEVKHHPREFGHSKYGVSRLVKGFLDLISVYLLTGFSGRPFHLIGSIGMFCFAVGALGITYLSAMWVISRSVDSMAVLHLHQTAIFYYCILSILLGAQFLTAGLLAELIVSRTAKNQSNVSIADRTGERQWPHQHRHHQHRTDQAPPENRQD